MSPGLPSAAPEPERYRGRPLLAILENYILDCIGELPPDRLEGTAALVRRAFGGDGADWRATVRARLELTPSLDENLRTMWKRNQEIAARANAQLHPVQFAKMVADENFAHLIGPPPSG